MGNVNNIKLIKYPTHSAQLHHRDDEDYTNFVVALIKKLFGIVPAVYHREVRSVRTVTISSRAFVVFCNQDFNFQIGNKMRQRIDIPNWIKRDQKFSLACMRGLFDTDGSVVIHRYWVGGKRYSYKKLEFCSMSTPLRKSAYDILSNLGMHPRIAREKSVWLDSKSKVETYFKSVGTHNLKHWKRYKTVLESP